MPNDDLQPLIRLVQALKTEDEVRNFWLSFFTPAERETLTHRDALVKLLLAKVPQRDIAERLGVGMGTVTRGSKELQFGAGKDFWPQLYERIDSDADL